MKKLFLEDGTEAGLFDVIQWWVGVYPSDIFVESPKEIVAIRKNCEALLKQRKDFVR